MTFILLHIYPKINCKIIPKIENTHPSAPLAPVAVVAEKHNSLLLPPLRIHPGYKLSTLFNIVISLLFYALLNLIILLHNFSSSIKL